MVVQQNILEKAYFIIKLTGRAMVRPASADKWKAPLVLKTASNKKTIFCWNGLVCSKLLDIQTTCLMEQDSSLEISPFIFINALALSFLLFDPLYSITC